MSIESSCASMVLNNRPEMAYPGKTWSQELTNTLENGSLSISAKKYIEGINQKTESGRMGFVAAAYYLMATDKWPGKDLANKIMLDSSWNLFALRIIDDYVDESSITTNERCSRLEKLSKVINKEEVTPVSIPEEAAFFSIKTSLEKFAKVKNYKQTMEALLKAVKILESSVPTKDNFLSLKELDNVISFLTVLPTVDFVESYISPNLNAYNAFYMLTSSTRTLDHLADMKRDQNEGTSNYVLFDIQNFISSKTESKIVTKYIKEVIQSFWNGSKLLNGKARLVYQTLSCLTLAKYLAEYKIFACSDDKNSIAKKIAKTLIRSYRKN